MPCEIYLQVPDKRVAAIVGKYGQHLAEIRNTSGAKVAISQKGELVPNTNDRLVTVSGTVQSIHMAHILILQRLQESQETQLQSRHH